MFRFTRICNCFFQIPDLPQEMWLLKTDDQPIVPPELRVDMSRYFTKISEEMDKWLFKGSGDPLVPCPFSSSLEQRTSDNPWLMTSRSSSTRSRSLSPAYSTTSSTASVKSKKQTNKSKWLLSGQSNQSTSNFSCPFMERFISDMNNLSWLKSEQPQFEHDFKGVANPLSSYEDQNNDISKWLKPVMMETSFMKEEPNPLASLLERYKETGADQWLLSSELGICDSECKLFDMRECGGDEGKWLMPASSLCPLMEQIDDDEDIL